MKQNTTMAKVITMKAQIIKDEMLVLVTTVDPSMTPEWASVMYGIPGYIVSAEESCVMPLGFALDYARRQRAKLGITNYVSFTGDYAA